MQDDLKRAHDLLNVDFQEIVDAILEDDNFTPLNNYIRRLQKLEDEMWAWSSMTKIEARELFHRYLMFQDSADFEVKAQKIFKQSMRDRLGESVAKIIVIGSRLPDDAVIANEIFEEWEHEDTLHDIAEMVSDDLNARINVAQDILLAIEDFQIEFGTSYDDDIIKYVCDMMFDEIDRVKELPSLIEYERQINQMANLRKKFRKTRRQLQIGDFDSYSI